MTIEECYKKMGAKWALIIKMLLSVYQVLA